MRPEQRDYCGHFFRRTPCVFSNLLGAGERLELWARKVDAAVLFNRVEIAIRKFKREFLEIGGLANQSYNPPGDSALRCRHARFMGLGHRVAPSPGKR